LRLCGEIFVSVIPENAQRLSGIHAETGLPAMLALRAALRAFNALRAFVPLSRE
jgi:hypothetical protein